MKYRPYLAKALLVACLWAATLPGRTALAADGTPPPRGYNPALTYPGPLVPNVVYYRNSPRSKWQRGLRDLYSKGVNCPDALRHFRRDGLWAGHLNPDGSCGPLSEPSEFALGNRVNFDTGAQTPK